MIVAFSTHSQQKQLPLPIAPPSSRADLQRCCLSGRLAVAACSFSLRPTSHGQLLSAWKWAKHFLRGPQTGSGSQHC